MQVGADECTAMVGNDARADVRLLFDEKDNLRPINEWPDSIAQSIDSVDLVNGKVKLVSKLGARRLILELHGKLKPEKGSDALRDLADILAEKWRPSDSHDHAKRPAK